MASCHDASPACQHAALRHLICCACKCIWASRTVVEGPVQGRAGGSQVSGHTFINTLYGAPAQAACPSRAQQWPAGRRWLGGQPPTCLHSARRCRCTGKGRYSPSLLPVPVHSAVSKGSLQDAPTLPEGRGAKVQVIRLQATILLTADTQSHSAACFLTPPDRAQCTQQSKVALCG